MNELLNDYLKANTPAEEQVKNYILGNASEVLQEKILSEAKKNIKDCLNYVAKQVKEKAESGCYCATDEEVYGMCVHYFEEDSIEKEEKEVASVSTSAVKPKKEIKPKKEVKPQPTLFDLLGE